MNYKLVMAIIAVVLLVGGGIAEEYVAREIFTEFTERIEIIMDSSEDKEYDMQAIEETEDWWEERHKVLEIMLPHIPLNEIVSTYGEMLGSAKADDYESTTALLSKLYSLSLSLKEMFGFRLGNIL